MKRDGYNPGCCDGPTWESAKDEARAAMIDKARHKDVICYSDLVLKITKCDLEPHDIRLNHMLYEIAFEEDEAGRGLLTALVVHKNDGAPGSGFFEMAEERGRDVSDPETCWIEELKNVHAVWSQH